MRLQTCRFRRTRDSEWETGVAFSMSGFNAYDAMDILDSAGKLVGESPMHDYILLNPDYENGNHLVLINTEHGV